jgi:hypothetical protein
MNTLTPVDIKTVSTSDLLEAFVIYMISIRYAWPSTVTTRLGSIEEIKAEIDRRWPALATNPYEY